MDGVVIKVHINFKKRIERFINEFEKVHKIRLSYCKATKLIDEKIEEAGGLVV